MIIITILYSIILVFCIAQHIQGFPCSWNITFPMLTACCIAIYGSAEDMYYEDLCKLCVGKTDQMPRMRYYLTEPSLFYGWLLFSWIVYIVTPWASQSWWSIYISAFIVILYSIYSRLLEQKITLENLYNK